MWLYDLDLQDTLLGAAGPWKKLRFFDADHEFSTT